MAAPEIHKTVLDNGLTVLITPMPSSETVSVYAFVRSGSATEGNFMGMGISHFLEHMLFKGTKRRMVGEIAKEVKALGGTINASTDLDYTMYTLDVPKEKLKDGIDLIADMMQNSVIDEKEVEKERKVIHGEMRLYYDKPQRRLSVDVFKNVYIHHPYRHPTIGYEPLFDSITPKDLYKYYKRHYIPNNMIISVAGGLEANDALELVKKHFKDFKSRPYLQHDTVAEPPQISERYYEEYYQTPLFWFSLAFQGIPLTDPDVYAMDLLSMALGRGQGSRLYKDLYLDKKLVTQISSMNYTPFSKGIFEIEGTMEKDNLMQVRNAALQVIERVKTNGLHPRELAKIKNQAAAQFVYENQTSSSIAYRAALEEAMTGDYQFSKHYVDMIARVSNDDIKRVAKKYLNDSQLSVTVVKPLAAKSLQEDRVVLTDKNDVQKHVLENGLTLLIKEDHVASLVSVQVVLNGGLRSETKENNGITGLFASVWGKATKSQSQSKIINDLEFKAASCSAYSGYNALGISMQFLTKDLDYGLNLLSDIVKNPIFEEDEIKRQKDLINVAIDSRDDDVRATTFREAMSLLYQKHPYHMDILGTKETIAAISSKDLRNYYNRFVNPSNMVISVFGDVDAEKVENIIHKYFGKLKKSDVSIDSVKEPEIIEPRLATLQKKKEQAVVAIAFHAPTFTDPDRFIMEAINATLGAGLSGRLFIKVRDELGKAYTVGSFYTPGVDTGNIMLYSLTTNSKVESVKEIMLKEVVDLGANLISDEEFENVKSYLKGAHQRGLLTIGSKAARTAFNTLYGLGYDFDRKYNNMIDAITKKQIKDAATKYLNPAKAVIVTTLGENDHE